VRIRQRLQSGANIFLKADRSAPQWFREAVRYIPGGTSKANLYMRPHALYVRGGTGAGDGPRRGGTPRLHQQLHLPHPRHAFPPVVQAVTAQLTRGTNFAFSTPEELLLAKLLSNGSWTGAVRFGNSGTEAVMMAIKAARAFTGRDRIAKIEGAYHGYYDDVQVSFHSEPRTGSGRCPGEPAQQRRHSEAPGPGDPGAPLNDGEPPNGCSPATRTSWRPSSVDRSAKPDGIHSAGAPATSSVCARSPGATASSSSSTR